MKINKDLRFKIAIILLTILLLFMIVVTIIFLFDGNLTSLDFVNIAMVINIISNILYLITKKYVKD